MATRKEYNQCMIPYISGQGKSKEERKLNFCVGAKLCSGKSKTEEEARVICSQPKPPKPEKTGNPSARGKFCTLRDLDTVAACAVESIDISKLTPENIQQTFTNALRECTGGKVKKVSRAKKALEELDPQQLEAIKTMALLSEQAEGRAW